MFFRLSSVLFFDLCAHTSVRVLKWQQNMLSVVRKRRRGAAGWQDENQIRPFCYRSQCWATAENSQTIIVFPWRQAYFAGRSGTSDDIGAESCLKSFFPWGDRQAEWERLRVTASYVNESGFRWRHLVWVVSRRAGRFKDIPLSLARPPHPSLFIPSYFSLTFPLLLFTLPFWQQEFFNHGFSVSRRHARQLHLHFFYFSFFPPSVYCACNASAILGLREASRSGAV